MILCICTHFHYQGFLQVDQIIKMDIDKVNGNAVSYVSGSIENPEINQCIVDVLEGTYPAFNNRNRKYLKKE